MALTQLNPQIPLVTPRGNAQAVAVIDYSEEHDLKWVCILDAGGAVWTFSNAEVRGFANPTMGRTKEEPRSIVSDAFCRVFMEAPKACFDLLNISLTPAHVRAAVAQIEQGKINLQRPDWMPDFTPPEEHRGAG